MAKLYATWDPDEKSSYVDLSNENLTATRGDQDTWQLARATQGKDSGKHYFEVIPTSSMVVFGFSTDPRYTGSASMFPGYRSDRESWGHHLSSATRYYHSAAYSDLGICPAGTTYRVKADLDAGLIYTAVGSADFFAIPLNYTNVAGTTIYPAVGLYYTGDQIVANFGQDPFIYDVPDGYNAGWYEDIVYIRYLKTRDLKTLTSRNNIRRTL